MSSEDNLEKFNIIEKEYLKLIDNIKNDTKIIVPEYFNMS